MGVDEILREKRQAIIDLATRYDVHNVRVFGSVARGDARPDSDIDLLVDLGPEVQTFALMDLWEQLEALLGREVDLIPERALRQSVREQVLKEAVPL